MANEKELTELYSGAAAIAAGLLDSVEKLHPTKTGYGDISAAYYALIRRIAE